MLGYAGEVRLMAIEYANDPGVAAGAVLQSGQTIAVLLKRGRTPVTGVVLGPASDPVRSAPSISGTRVVFWGLLPPANRYIVRGSVVLSNGETAKAEVDLVVE